ncbi:MAG: hypothetical protein GXX85_02625 [Ignavibacteria bacterium]|nr:hypothetical protein [Ignavibacteria bacterium]
MPFESLTDDKLADLLNCPKKVLNPQAKCKNKDGHEQINFKVISTDGSDYKFEVYKRQNKREGMEDDFSCGISWIAPNGETLTLKRYNGCNHNHSNQIEKTQLGYNCHIHYASEKYIRNNKKAEGFASITDRYNIVNGALHCLVTDCKITGLNTTPDETQQIGLFDQ